jgi:Family of unknown function (DUF6448)
MSFTRTSVVVVFVLGTILAARTAAAHCDTADEALRSGGADRLVKGITHHIEEGIRERFARAAAAKKQADASVTAGREFVEAYVEFTHYVERLHLDATTPAAHGAGAPAAEHKH